MVNILVFAQHSTQLYVLIPSERCTTIELEVEKVPQLSLHNHAFPNDIVTTNDTFIQPRSSAKSSQYILFL